MELCFALINGNNIRSMVKELLFFLEKCDPEFKADTSSSLVIAAEKYAPNKRWQIDIILKVLTTAGNYCRDDVVSSLIALIQDSASLHAYTVQQMYRAVVQDISQQPLVQVAAWCMGEYGDLLLQPLPDSDDEPLQISEDDVLEVLEKALVNNNSSVITKEYCLTALVKLCTRFTTSQPRLQKLLRLYNTSTNTELQQRSVEYDQLFQTGDSIRTGLLERMPVVEKANTNGTTPVTNGNVGGGGENEEDLLEGDQGAAVLGMKGKLKQQPETQNILDLLDTSPSLTTVTSTTNNTASNKGSAGGDLLDLLGDLDVGGSGGSNGASHPPLASTGGGLLDGLGRPSGALNNGTATPSIQGITAYDKSGLKIDFEFERSAVDGVLSISLTATNSNSAPLTDFVFQAAVPKSFQLQLLSPSGSIVPANNSGSLTQVMKITNPQKVRN